MDSSKGSKSSGSSASHSPSSASGSSPLGGTVGQGVGSSSNAGSASGAEGVTTGVGVGAVGATAAGSAARSATDNSGVDSRSTALGETSTDVSGGQDDEATGRANRVAGTAARAFSLDGALDQGNSGPTPGSLDAKKALQDAQERAAKAEKENEELRARAQAQGSVQRIELVPAGGLPVAPTKGLDTTIPGGRYQRADGQWINAHGQEIEQDGTVIDNERNRDADPARRGII